jgi:hypothetical protein
MDTAAQPVRATATPQGRLRPASTFRVGKANLVSLGLVLVAAVATALLTTGEGFAPRVDTIDALAGLAVGAFAVDRVLTFVPPWGAANDADTRAQDIDMLRWGWGALLGALFVALTGLGAVAALTGNAEPIDSRLDRVIAVLAIAGGVKGLARFKDAVNPPKKKTEGGTEQETEETQPTPGTVAYVVGFAALAVACGIAAVFAGDDHGMELIASEPQADGTVALVARFGTLFVAAVVVEQLIERSFASSITGPAKKLVVASAAVVLGVVAARLMDLYLLHNIGFFGTAQGSGGLDAALARSTSAELLLDVVVTGLVIAAGTAPLHDLASALRRAKETAQEA